MRKLPTPSAVLSGALLFFVPICVRAQVTVIRDPEIESMVREVSPDSLQSYIKSMVSFGTRSTVSSTTDPKR
ncbi:MAG: peptidase M28, partial [Bacteroidota bacterium]|nr:peptidase M28 [Bacteroidota bacterium]